jgi:hypothetical protein
MELTAWPNSDSRRDTMLTPNTIGHYHFLPGGDPYSSGVVADAGYEIVHVTLRRLTPWRAGFDLIDTHLSSVQQPRTVLCGIELRSPKAFHRSGFIEFNRGYRSVLEEWGLLVDGVNPVARTNVVPAWNPPAEESLYGFSYLVPSGEPAWSFVVAGGGELRGGPMLEAEVIRPGDTSPEGLAEKAAYVMKAMTRRLEGLGRTWDDVTATEVYTVYPIDALAGPQILDRIGAASVHGLRWHHARPPIDELDFEMDVRGVARELYL